MPTFISDPTNGFYLVLIAFAAITGVMAARKQDRKNLVPFGIAAGVLLLVFLIDHFVESPREESTRKVQAMADAVTAADPDRFVEHLSTSFEYHGKNRDAVKSSHAWDMLRNLKVRAAVWGFGHDSASQISATETEIGFYAKGEAQGGGMVMRYVKARFVKDPDGQYRLKGMQFFDPADKGTNQEVIIKGFP